MTEVKGGVPIIQREPADRCEQCGRLAELRPYGPCGLRICVDCGMKDKAGTEARMGVRLFGPHKSN